MKKPPLPALPEADAETFKVALKSVLGSLGMPKTELAKALQLGVRQLDNWLVAPTADQLDRIVANLRRSPEWRDAFEHRLRACAAGRLAAAKPVSAGVDAAFGPGRSVPASALLPERLLPKPAGADSTVDLCETHIVRRLAYLQSQSLGGPEDPGSLHRSFVNLQLRPGRSAEPSQAPQPFDSLDDLLAKHPHTPVWLLIGEPGGGKSTLLFDLELRRAAACLAQWRGEPAGQASAAARADVLAQAAPELCIRVALANYTAGTSAPPADWVAEQWSSQFGRPGDAPPTLAVLARRARLRFLLDGLNEIRASTPEARKQAQQDFMHWAARLGASGLPAPLFTIRRIDMVPLSTGLDGEPAPAEVDVLPWSDTDVRHYCELRFPGQDNPVWQAMSRHAHSAALLALMRNPFNLKLQCDLFRQDGQLAANRGALLGRIGLLRLQAALAQDKLPPLPDDLLHPSDALRVQKLAAPPQPGDEPAALHHLRLRGRLLRSLAALCRRLHERDGAAWSRFSHGDPVLDAPEGPLDDALHAAQALLLLDDDGRTLRLAHQLWQEYLAAIDLAQGCQVADWPDLSAPPQPAVSDTDWQLPSPLPSEWDQCAQLAVQLADAPAHLLAHLADANLALAARAALSLGVHRLPPALLAGLRQCLLARCQHAGTGLPQRIEAGELLGLLDDDLRYETGTGPDGAVYRVPRWGSHWLPVPAGKRLIGGLADRQDSANMVEVDVPPGLQLAFAPVTNAEFRCFIDAGGYGGQDDAEPPAWWQGAAALRWWRGELADEGQRDAWLDARRRWAAGEQDWVRKTYFSALSDNEFDEIHRPRLDADQADFDRWLDGICAPRRHRLPNGWDNPRHANPLQPVVGVSLFEAQAYARWLSHQTGQRLRLPHEAEWEVAARGGVQRAWPWQDDAVVADLPACMNYLDTRVRRTTPVGVFPAGQSPEGHVDLAGQVWEWTGSAYTPDGLQADTALAEASPDDAGLWRAVRGGGWHHAAGYCRPAFRGRGRPAVRIDLGGFRLLCCPIHEP